MEIYYVYQIGNFEWQRGSGFKIKSHIKDKIIKIKGISDRMAKLPISTGKMNMDRSEHEIWNLDRLHINSHQHKRNNKCNSRTKI